jgi:hypothetical protein
MKIFFVLLIFFVFCSCQNDSSCRLLTSPNKINTLFICKHFYKNKNITTITVNKDSSNDIYRTIANGNYLLVENAGRDRAWSILVEWKRDTPIIYTPEYGFSGDISGDLIHVKVDTFLKLYHSDNELIKIDQ